MSADDMRKYNGGARKGAGRPETVGAWHQVAVRLNQDMTRWIWRQRGSPAEVLRRLVQEAMEREIEPPKPQTSTAQEGVKTPKTKT